jgi:hypothetical protein
MLPSHISSLVVSTDLGHRAYGAGRTRHSPHEDTRDRHRHTGCSVPQVRRFWWKMAADGRDGLGSDRLVGRWRAQRECSPEVRLHRNDRYDIAPISAIGSFYPGNRAGWSEDDTRSWTFRGVVGFRTGRVCSARRRGTRLCGTSIAPGARGRRAARSERYSPCRTFYRRR